MEPVFNAIDLEVIYQSTLQIARELTLNMLRTVSYGGLSVDGHSYGEHPMLDERVQANEPQ